MKPNPSALAGLAFIAGLFVAVTTPASAAPSSSSVTLTRLDDRVRIEIGGNLFTEYRFRGAPKPCFFPILDADGTSYTRSWPLESVPGEIQDHDWHRSVWFGHGLVNGHDFWRELPDKSTGTIVHEEILEQRGGARGVLRVRNRWVAANGETICTDETTYGIEPVEGGFLLDFEIALHASHGRLVLGDTEEGAFAVRVNEGIRVSQGQGRDRTRGTGRIVNAHGDLDRQAWGKRAPWCDYSGTVSGRTIGVAIFDHPSNPSFPTWWHVRDYGLFAANPFGRHDFEKRRDDPHLGDIVVPAGGTFTLRHRIFFHRGDTETARVAEHYRRYSTLD